MRAVRADACKQIPNWPHSTLDFRESISRCCLTKVDANRTDTRFDRGSANPKGDRSQQKTDREAMHGMHGNHVCVQSDQTDADRTDIMYDYKPANQVENNQQQMMQAASQGGVAVTGLIAQLGG